MKVRSFVIVLFVLALGFTLGACSDNPNTATTVSTVAVSGSVPAVGTTSQFAATATMLNGSTQDVSSTATWSSSNSGVATVSSSGLVTALTSGSVTITATYSGITGNDAITVP